MYSLFGILVSLVILPITLFAAPKSVLYPGVITTQYIKDGAVTQAKLASGAGGGGDVSVHPCQFRNSVCQARTDDNNNFNYVSSGVGLNAVVFASTQTPLILDFANGYSLTSAGLKDDTVSITALGTLSLPANATSYIYATYVSSSEVKLNSYSGFPPQYDRVYPSWFSNQSLYSFNNTVLDVYGNSTLSYTGVPTYDAGGIFGQSVLSLPSISDVETTSMLDFSKAWTIDGWFKFSTLDTPNCIYTSLNTGSNQNGLYAQSNGELYYYRNGPSGVHSSPFAAGIVPDTYYYIESNWDGTTFRIFVDGTMVYSLASTDPSGGTRTLRIGSDPGYVMHGNISDFRVTLGLARHITSYAKPTKITQPQDDTLLFTNINDGTQEFINPLVIVSTRAIPLGEILTDSSSVNTVTTYPAYVNNQSTGFEVNGKITSSQTGGLQLSSVTVNGAVVIGISQSPSTGAQLEVGSNVPGGTGEVDIHGDLTHSNTSSILRMFSTGFPSIIDMGVGPDGFAPYSIIRGICGTAEGFVFQNNISDQIIMHAVYDGSVGFRQQGMCYNSSNPYGQSCLQFVGEHYDLAYNGSAYIHGVSGTNAYGASTSRSLTVDDGDVLFGTSLSSVTVNVMISSGTLTLGAMASHAGALPCFKTGGVIGYTTDLGATCN